VLNALAVEEQKGQGEGGLTQIDLLSERQNTTTTSLFESSAILSQRYLEARSTASVVLEGGRQIELSPSSPKGEM
jgi:hypothetical protein